MNDTEPGQAEPKDEDIEARAVELAHDDQMEWVQLPSLEGRPEPPPAASNAERDEYRRRAREQLKAEQNGGRP